MQKVTGIKSVDFKIKALGHGVVNWNGPTTLTGDDGKTVDNHTLPKLRGYTNLTGKVKDETGYKYKKQATDINFKETPLYISQNCIRHHLFREQAFDLHFASDKNLKNVLASITGLIRGYVVPASQCKRTSPLLLEDFVDQLGNGNFEQYGQAGARDSTSFFSKTTFGDTEYISYGSISIEQLQFISLDKKFDRAAMVIKEGEGEVIAAELQSYIKSLNPCLNPQAIFHGNYVRIGTIFEEGECGILLNDDAVKALVDETLDRLANLSIRQAKGYMYVDEITVDYNDSHKMMRIKRDESEIINQQYTSFAQYFYAK
ncbi:type I-Fv CRISPR-associated protein Cas7fv [Vibrio sp. AH4]|uniref:type I-Fv CRISPR-associated protein Cas7fv n=1 Tax=Vibrio sp. AH4 TaxID=2919577 RepID=UPI0027399F9E|nr:type I-Fv CRISPR-associated protein Cas7fv [Vibrio sp. AH4]MDP4491559.1 type I-Fv CRISPR-associated protein Cas7fv [Vibrio sp. AH4]